MLTEPAEHGPAGLPIRNDSGWELTDPRGRRIQPNPDTPIQLWHPIRETAEDVRAWRDHLLEHGIPAVQAGVPRGLPAGPGRGTGRHLADLAGGVAAASSSHPSI
ncbi:DUF4132 domain-containing protein [Streptosporangium sp. CA-135522]|uniref:DUF4132 domain-containing protein n=1 Tax=Streptosporangium sp. CA-135522 TaxID=3240072 RepID=UPI003D8BA3C1